MFNIKGLNQSLVEDGIEAGEAEMQEYMLAEVAVYEAVTALATVYNTLNGLVEGGTHLKKPLAALLQITGHLLEEVGPSIAIEGRQEAQAQSSLEVPIDWPTSPEVEAAWVQADAAYRSMEG